MNVVNHILKFKHYEDAGSSSGGNIVISIRKLNGNLL